MELTAQKTGLKRLNVDNVETSCLLVFPPRMENRACLTHRRREGGISDTSLKVKGLSKKSRVFPPYVVNISRKRVVTN